MSKKRNKSPANNAGNTNKWEPNIVSAELNETNWSYSLSFLVENIPEDTETLDFINTGILTGLRKRFTLITMEKITNLITEFGNPKSKKGKDAPANYEICESGKLCLDKGEPLPVLLLARFIKWIMLSHKTEDLKQLSDMNKKNEGKSSKAKKPAEKTERVKSSGGKKGPQASGKKSPEPPSVKQDSKLRKRGDPDPDIQYIDDEPDDGSSRYFIVSGIVNCQLLEALTEIGCVATSIIKITRDIHIPIEKIDTNENESDNGSADSLKDVDNIESAYENTLNSLNNFWSDLNNVLNNNKDLMNTPVVTFVAKHLMFPIEKDNEELKTKCSMDLFEALAVLKYDLFDLKRQWKNYLSKSKLISLPSKSLPIVYNENTPRESMKEEMPPTSDEPSSDVTFDKIDMEYYNYLLQDVALESTSIYMQMGAMLDQVEITCGEKSPDWNLNKPEQSNETNEKMMDLLRTMTENIYLPKNDLLELQEMLKQSKSDKDLSKDHEKNVPIHSLDSITLRDREIDSEKFGKNWVLKQELEMLITSFRHLKLMNIVPVDDKIGLKRIARLQELLKYLDNTGLSSREINYAMQMFIMENVTLSGVDENGFIRTNNEDGIFQRNIHPVWDDPYMIIDEVSQSILEEEINLSKKELYTQEREHTSFLISEFTSSSLKSDHNSEGILKSSRLSSRSQSPEQVKPTRRKSSVRFVDEETEDQPRLAPETHHDIMAMLRDQDENFFQNLLMDYLTNIRKRDLNEWCFEEYYEPHVLLQIIHDAIYKLPFVDIYNQRQMDGQIVVLHNPFQPDSKLNQQPWDQWLHSNVGFRNYLDYVNDKITDWIRDEEAIYQASLLSKELQNVEIELKEPDTRGRPNKIDEKSKQKNASRSKSRSSTGTSSENEDSNKEFTLILRGSLKAQKLEQDKINRAKEEEELKKEQKQQLSARKKSEKEIPKDGDKAKDAKRPSSKDSNKSKIKKTAFEDSNESFEKENIPESIENKIEETYWPFISYNLGDNLAHFSGNVAHLFPCDGSTIRIFKMQKLLDSTSIRVSVITTQSHVFTVHIVDPSFVQNPEIDNYQKVLDYFENPKNLCRYGASTCTFNDGIIITSSNNGYNGTIDKSEIAQMSSESCGNENISQRSAEQMTTENQMLSSQDTSGDIADTNCKSPQRKSKCKNRMDLLDIPNLVLSIPNGVQVKIGYALTDNNKIGRQLSIFMSKKNVTKIKTNSSENLLNTTLETGRYITSDGCVISIFDNDSIKVMFADGTVAVTNLVLESVTITIQETEDNKLEKSSAKESPTQKKRTKQSKSTIPLEQQQQPNNPTVTGELKQKTNYFRKWNVTLPNGEIFETVADLNSLFSTKSSMLSNETVNESETINEEKKDPPEITEITEKKNYFRPHSMMEPLLVSSATDPSTGETLVTRSDGTLLLVSKDSGIFLAEHSDGTRFTKYFIIEKLPSINHESGEGNKSKITELLLIESKQYPSVTIDITHGQIETRFGSMGTLLSDFTGQHVFKHSDNTEIEYRPDGEIIFTASNNAQMTYLQPGGPCSYVFNTTSNIICEIVDNEGTEFSVDINGDYIVKTINKSEKQSSEQIEDEELDQGQDNKYRPCSSAISMTNDNNGNIRKYDQHAPRLFSMNADGSGSELLRYRDIVETLVNSEIEEDYLHYKEEIQDSPQIVAHTILHPDCKKKPWEYEYTRKTVLPKGLTCRDLKSFPAKETVVKGPQFAMKVGRGLEIFSNPIQSDSDMKQVKHPNQDLWLNPMQFRQFHHYPVITNDIRNNFSTQLVDYNKKILVQRQQYNNLELFDDRSNEEKIAAHETRKRFAAMQHSYKQTINNAINNLSQNDEKTKQTTNNPQWEINENTKPTLNRRKFDILLEQKQLNQEKEMEDKFALRNKIVPKYFTSIYGKEFISNQAMDLQSLNKSMKLFTLSRDGTSANNFEAEEMQQKNETPETLEESVHSNSDSRDSFSSVAEQVLQETPEPKSSEKDSKLVFRKKEKKYVYYDSDLFIPTAPKRTPLTSELNLPKYLYSQRPTVEPNIRQAIVEDSVRRKVYTTSLIGGSDTSQVFQRQTRGINVLPARIDTGLLREGQNYQYQLKLINTGPESSYFKIKQPAQSTGIWVEFLPGPIAAGLSRKIKIHIYAIANDPAISDSDVFLIDQSLEITTNTDKLIIPIVGRVMRAAKYDSIYHLTNSPSVADPIPKDYVASQDANVVP